LSQRVEEGSHYLENPQLSVLAARLWDPPATELGDKVRELRPAIGDLSLERRVLAGNRSLQCLCEWQERG
jgi:hypothetical protein